MKLNTEQSSSRASFPLWLSCIELILEPGFELKMGLRLPSSPRFKRDTVAQECRTQTFACVFMYMLCESCNFIIYFMIYFGNV